MLWSLIFISLIGRARLNGEETAPCNAAKVSELNGTTSQSSTHTHDEVVFSSERAFGNVSECSHTKQEINSWWRIDLLGVYRIYCISIFNNHDEENVKLNISGAQIYIGNSRKKNGTTNYLRKNITDFKVKKKNTFVFDENVSGRYITVFLPKDSALILCELKIFGIKKGENNKIICNCFNPQVSRVSAKSRFKLIKENKTWVDALEHCRDQDMHLASIVNKKTQAWAELEARDSDTPFVWLGLRYTCTLEFWFWVEDKPVKFRRWASNGKIDECNMSGAMQRQEDHLWFSKSEVEKFNFICAK